MLVTSCSSLHTKGNFEKHVIITTIISLWKANKKRQAVTFKMLHSSKSFITHFDHHDSLGKELISIYELFFLFINIHWSKSA